MRPAWCDIDLGALTRNADALHAFARQPLLAMVKSNGYGHGLKEVVDTLTGHPGIWGMGVALVSEAADLRELGYRGRILVLGGLSAEEAPEAVETGAIIAISRIEVARALDIAAHGGKPVPVHLKVDVGMHRLGIPFEEAEKAARAIEDLPSVNLEGVLTHLGAAHHGDDASRSRTAGELARFGELITRLRRRHENLITHASNSSALMASLGAELGLARPGMALYGWSPAAWLPSDPHLEPVASVRAQVVLVKETGNNVKVGYSQTPLEEGRRIGVLPVGYGDGIPMAWGLAPGRVLFEEGEARFVGSVSMDSCIVDITELPGVEVGSTALLLGSGTEGTISPEEVAGATGRNAYEILTGLTPRLPRHSHG